MAGEKLLLKNRANFRILVLILAASALFTTCENDPEVVTDLWEQLRSTAWTKTSTENDYVVMFKGPDGGNYRTYLENESHWNSFKKEYGEDCIIQVNKIDAKRTYTIGFYGPKNGPFASSTSLVVPYCVTIFEYESEIGICDPKAGYPFPSLSTRNSTERIPSGFPLEINRYGNQIVLSDVRFDPQNITLVYFTHSLGISVSGDRLTISQANNHITLSSGTYTKISSDPDYDWVIYGGGNDE